MRQFISTRANTAWDHFPLQKFSCPTCMTKGHRLGATTVAEYKFTPAFHSSWFRSNTDYLDTWPLIGEQFPCLSWSQICAMWPSFCQQTLSRSDVCNFHFIHFKGNCSPWLSFSSLSGGLEVRMTGRLWKPWVRSGGDTHQLGCVADMEQSCQLCVRAMILCKSH